MATPNAKQIADANIVFLELKKQGYSKESSAGVLGNLFYETGYTLDPKMNEVGGGGYGIGQWTPKENVYRQGKLIGLTRDACDTLVGQSKIVAKGDVTGQWMASGVPVNYPNMTKVLPLKTFKKMTDIEQCAIDFMAHWERPRLSTSRPEIRIEWALAIYPHLDGKGGENGVQLAVLPCHGTVYITQAPGGNTSHLGSYSIDFAYPVNKVPLYAPFDMKCVWVDVSSGNNNSTAVVWQSLREVQCVDGTVSFVTFNTIHDIEWRKNKVGDTKNKGEVYAHTGVGGNATGDHTHIEASKTKFTVPFYTNPAGQRSLPNASPMQNIFSICSNVTGEETKIIDQAGAKIDWKCLLDYQDGEGGGDDGDDGGKGESFDDTLRLLMLGVLNGWGQRYND